MRHAQVMTIACLLLLARILPAQERIALPPPDLAPGGSQGSPSVPNSLPPTGPPQPYGSSPGSNLPPPPPYSPPGPYSPYPPPPGAYDLPPTYSPPPFV